jgi:hypothetical protein
MSDLGATRLADLWTRHLAGEPLAEDEATQLHEAFASDELFRQRVMQDRRLDGALRATAELRQRQPELLETMHQLVRAALHSDGFVERLRLRLASEEPPRKAWARRIALGGLAAAAVAAAVVALAPRPSRPVARRAAAPTTMGRALVRHHPVEQRMIGRDDGRRAVLLLGDSDPNQARLSRQAVADEEIRTRMESLGFSVQVLTVEDQEVPLKEALERAQVVVLSPSIMMGDLPEELVDLPVAMVALESSAFTRLGLTGPAWKRDVGPVAQRSNEVLIVEPTHPLAAGLTGQPTVLEKKQGLRWGLPGDEAIIVARFPGPAKPPQSAIFAYERGSEMPGGRAAARRVALFLGNGRVIRSLTPDGWKLFDAAVTWSAGGP